MPKSAPLPSLPSPFPEHPRAEDRYENASETDEDENAETDLDHSRAAFS
jgi:hypothetical protein